ncbi:MAG: glycerophosphodiester phosphodiesterase [Rhodobacteraceae bacterium]|nr:glycerophosphodiester phosphodiesterase [Paracoccaceae bacterium]
MQIFPIALSAVILFTSVSHATEPTNIQLGPRPFYLFDKMPDGQLRSKLRSCANGPFSRTNFSIGHRGAPLQFPEHTRESYQAAARMGAGIIECDVTFTADLALVCRHSQGDLATTTNILATPLAATCIKPFTPATFNSDGSIEEPASATCRTSELTLAEFLSLKGKMDAGNRAATTPEAFMNGTASWRTDLYATGGTLMSHAQSITLLQSLGVEFIPELKAPIVGMPFTSPVTGEVLTQAGFAQKMIDEYTAAGIPAQDVHPQSFNPDDLLYWLKTAPEFGKNAILLDGRKYDANNPSDTQAPTLQQIANMGITTVAPPQWVLLKEDDGQITPSDYALAAQDANLDIITWTLERSGRLREDVLDGRGKYYYQSTLGALTGDGDIYTTLDVLTQQVGIKGIFSDWPATVTFYANCMKL